MGAGANARHSIGTGIIGGMIGETTLAMLYVPLLFYLFDKLAERGTKEGPPAAAENSHGGGVPSTPAPHAERRDD
jgi:multidrug efflux pump